MSSNPTQSDAPWFRDEQTLLGLARRARHAHAAPAIPGYANLREVARGGQGVVYSATQVSTKNTVAIKVLASGALSTPAQARRFEREAELAAGLHHPNIVRVFDRGLTPEGWPFLVMEFVAGESLEAWSARQRVKNEPLPAPTAREGVALFAKVTDAVAFAHQRGVLHRDLKPSNIRIDERGEPRVLDFGLAKSMLAPETVAVSRSGQFMGSLPWASPEQVGTGDNAVDVRSDVYSLGVMLYELLTGQAPYPTSGSLTAAIHSIRESSPTPPRAFAPQIESDVQTIVLKCLEKEPGRRYPSAGELRDDLLSWLKGEPIRARRDSAWTTLGRAARRYRRLAWTSGAFALVLTIALVVSMRSLHVASRERDRANAQTQLAEHERDAARRSAETAQAINAFIHTTLSSPDPKASGRDVKVADVLDASAKSLETTLRDQPDAQVGVRLTLGGSYNALGLHKEAFEQFDKAAAVATPLLGEDAEPTLQANGGKAAAYYGLGQQAEALALARQVADRRQKNAATPKEKLLDSLSLLATCLDANNTFDESDKLKRRMIDEYRALRGPEHADTAEAINNLSVSLVARGKLDEALPLAEEVLRIKRATTGLKDPDTISALSNLSGIYKRKGDYERCAAMLREAVAAANDVWGPEHPTALIISNNLGDALNQLDHVDEAREVLSRVLETQRRTLGKDHERNIATMNNLGAVRRKQGALDEAEDLMRGAVDLGLAKLGPKHVRTLACQSSLGELLIARGKADEAASMLEHTVETAESVLGEKSWMTGAFLHNLASAHHALHKDDDAEREWTRAYNILAKTLGPSNDRAHSAADQLATMYAGSGRTELAAEWSAKAKQTSSSGGTK